MPTKFYGEPIEVELDAASRQPIMFCWRKKKYLIRTIRSSWQDVGFGHRIIPKRVAWRLRHHRNYFQVETDDGKVFEIYCDRTAKKKTWILFREI
ncbi:MAG: DUF6504 family protein [bacterium]|nr:DUF6504 family protein [bacterium]